MRLQLPPALSSYRTRRERLVRIRPASSADRPAIAEMLAELSQQTVERRYFRPGRLSPEAARRESDRLMRVSYDGAVLVAELCDGGAIVAVAELACRDDTPDAAEGAIVVTDAFQGEGIGHALAEQLGDLARAAALTSVRATVRADNIPVRRLIASLGRPFTLRPWRGEIQIVFPLGNV